MSLLRSEYAPLQPSHDDPSSTEKLTEKCRRRHRLPSSRKKSLSTKKSSYHSRRALKRKRKKINATTAAIKTLNLKYDLAKRLHEAHRRDLSAHERDLADLQELKRRLDEDTLAQGEEAVDFLPPIPDQTAQRKAEISLISKKLKEMEEDAHAKYFVQRLSEQHLVSMECYHMGILSTLTGLKRAFSPIRKVPAECWATVFCYRVEEDFEEYVKEPGDMSVQSTTMVLSQVCSFWRQVVHTERDLWRHFICGPDHAKTGSQIQRWKHYASFDPRSFAFITNFRARSNSPVPHNGSDAARTAISSTPHSIHILTSVNGEAITAAKELPFNGQTSLILQIAELATLGFINEICACFPAASVLGFKSTAHLPLLNPSIWKRGVPFERLFMDLTECDPFRIDYYCHENHVRELHVVHNGKSALVGDTRSFPRLEILGITPPDTEWLAPYKLPAIQRLVLYGPKHPAIAAPSLFRLSQHSDFHRIRDLELQNWPLYSPMDAPSWSVMPLVLAIAEKLRFVETIRCVDSFIEGECLVTLVKLLMGTTANQLPSKLKKVIVDCCSGITRRDCEAIASSVEKLVVYV